MNKYTHKDIDKLIYKILNKEFPLNRNKYEDMYQEAYIFFLELEKNYLGKDREKTFLINDDELQWTTYFYKNIKLYLYTYLKKDRLFRDKAFNNMKSSDKDAAVSIDINIDANNENLSFSHINKDNAYYSDYEELSRLELKEFIKNILTDREFLIINEIIYNEKTFIQVGESIGLSKQRIHQIYKIALEKLKDNGIKQYF